MTAPVETQHTVDQLLDLVFQDELTGLSNRRFLNNRIGRKLENATDRRPYSFLLLDIDFFKAINDTHGHSVGDRTLEGVARLLENSCAPDDEAIRFAGDEFVIYLPGVAAADALTRANDLVEQGRSICMPVKGGLDEVQLTLSVGVASFPDDGEHWDEVLERADQALYQAKRSGRDRAAVITPGGEPIVRGDDLSQIFPCPEYIGQAEALAWLQRHFDLWRSGTDEPHAPLFCCTGDHGTGKTRFLNEFAAMANEAELPVLHVTGSHELSDVCYGGLIRALIAHHGSLSELREFASNRLDEAERSLWERFLDTSRAEAPPISEAASYRLFTKILQLQSDQAGVVLLVDDLGLVDDSFASLIESFNVADAADKRFFIATAVESDDDSLPTPTLLSRLNPSMVTLRRLDDTGLRDMVSAILPTLRADDAFYQELHRVSCGNFMYVEEALKYLIQIGRLVYERSAWQIHDPRLDDLPTSLRELVARRLERLDPEIQAALAKASVVGGEIRPELLASVETTDAGHTLDLLDKARKLGLLDGGRLWEDRDYRFQYAAVKDTVYDQIPAEDRIVWHKQMATLHETLRDAPGLLQLGSLQYHLLRSDQHEQASAVKEQLDSFVTRGAPEATVSSAPETPLPSAMPKWPKPSPLSNDELTIALRLIHSLRASLQTARLYPADSRIVRAAYEELHTNFGRLFVFTESLDLAETDGELLINGEQPIRREDEKSLIDTLRRDLLKAGLSGVAFARGITLPQIEALLNTWLDVSNLEQDPVEVWNRFGSRDDIVHIDINARIYVALEDRILPGLVGSEVSDQAAESPTPSGGITDVVELFQRWAQQAAPADGKELSRDDKVRLGEMLCKLRELFFGEHALTQSTDPAGDDAWLDWDDFEEELPESDLPRPSELTQTGDVDQCIADIVSGNAKREARGYQQLALLGSEAAEPLYRLLTCSEDARVSQVAGEYLKALEFDFVQRVAGDLQHMTDPAVKLRLVQYAVPLIEDPQRRQQILLSAAAQNGQAAACEAISQLAAGPASEAAASLLSVMLACSPPVQVAICAALERLGDPICVEPLIVVAASWRGADSEQQVAVVAQACLTLGAFDTPEVNALLAGLLVAPSRWPWRKTPPRPVRKAALVGLEKIGAEPAQTVIAKYTDDADSWIRLRARRFTRSVNSSS